jgi:hypothetical protein
MISNFLFGLLLLNFITPVNKDTNNTCKVCCDTVWVIEEMNAIPNVTISAIVRVIERVCEEIHTPQGRECEIIIKDIDVIIKNITSGLSPDKICSNLGFCKTENKIDLPGPPEI